MEVIEYLKLATDKTEAGDLIKDNNLTETVVKLMSNYAEFRVKNCSIPAVMHRFIPQPIEIEKLMKEKLKHRMINDDLGWTGEWRMSAKDILDLIIDLQNGA